MRTPIFAFVLSALVTGLVVHLATVEALPRVIMSRAISTLSDAGIRSNSWTLAPRITPQNQTIVRSSPDLAYAICILDLRDAPLKLTAPKWKPYGSLSIFDRATANAHVSSLQGDQGDVTVIIAANGQAVPTAREAPLVRLPGTQGIALIRRLAPDPSLHAQATAINNNTTCTAL